MTDHNDAPSSGRAHRFGGDWTSSKLAVLEGYLSKYTTVISGKGLKIA